MVDKPNSIVISYELFHYTSEIIKVVFEMLARKEETEQDKEALKMLLQLKDQLTEGKKVDGSPYSTYLSQQEFSVLRGEMKPGKHLYKEYNDKFTIVTHDIDLKNGSVFFQGTVDDPATLFRIGHWVGIMHQMNIQVFGKDYKIDPDWDTRPNN